MEIHAAAPHDRGIAHDERMLPAQRVHGIAEERARVGQVRLTGRAGPLQARRDVMRPVVERFDQLHGGRAGIAGRAAERARAPLAVLPVARVEAPFGARRCLELDAGPLPVEAEIEEGGRLQRGRELRGRVVAGHESRGQREAPGARALEHGARPLREELRQLAEMQACAESAVAAGARAVVLVFAPHRGGGEVEVVRRRAALQAEMQMIEHDAAAVVAVVAQRGRPARAVDCAGLGGEAVAPVVAERLEGRDRVWRFVEPPARRASRLGRELRHSARVALQRGVGSRAVECRAGGIGGEDLGEDARQENDGGRKRERTREHVIPAAKGNRESVRAGPRLAPG